MKILITGRNSYVGTSFEQYIKKIGRNNQIDTIDVQDDKWKNYSFKEYDVVMNVAGIVHRNQKKTDENLYYKVNRDLAIELAKKSKNEGVKQFIQMSTMAVYGLEGKINKHIVIDANTICNPKSAYGKSKLEAEYRLVELNDKEFIVSIIRPPMIYGPNCKGNYILLSKLAKKTWIFPKIDNKRSMIYIENLCEILESIIINKKDGIFHPQDREYINTSKMVECIGKVSCNKVILSKRLGFIIILFAKKLTVCNKVFGNLVYDNEISIYSNNNKTLLEYIEEIEIREEIK